MNDRARIVVFGRSPYRMIATIRPQAAQALCFGDISGAECAGLLRLRPASFVRRLCPGLTEPFRRSELIDLSPGFLVKVLDAGDAERAQVGL